LTINVDGPPHERTFTCAAVLEGEQIGVGMGRTKKDAEQQAARQALAHLGFVPATA
jgi:ribonuclease-3